MYGKHRTCILVASCLYFVIIAWCDSVARDKRSGISDQRMAEIETLLALAKMKDNRKSGKGVAHGLIDPFLLGKRARSRLISGRLEPDDASMEIFPINSIGNTISQQMLNHILASRKNPLGLPLRARM